jgi:hypothetical protein
MNVEPLLIEDVDPLEEAVSITEARAQCEAPAYEDSDVDPQDDAMFAIWIAAAREHCENFLGLSLAPKVLSMVGQAFPGGAGGYRESFTYTGVCPPRIVRSGSSLLPYGIPLPLGPVRWASIEYGEESDALTLVQDVDFQIDRSVYPNRLLPLTTWPTIDGLSSLGWGYRVTYGAGYGVDSNASIPTPAAVKMAILGMVGYLYENRGNSVDLPELPKFVEVMLRPLRVRLGMA